MNHDRWTSCILRGIEEKEVQKTQKELRKAKEDERKGRKGERGSEKEKNQTL